MRLTVQNSPRKDVSKFLSETKGLPYLETVSQGGVVEIEVDDDDADDLEFILESHGFSFETEAEEGRRQIPFETPRLSSSKTPRTRAWRRN